MSDQQQDNYPPFYNELVIELSIATIYRLKQILGPMTEAEFERGDCYWHVYDSAFERGCDVLWRLGLAIGILGSEQFSTYEEWREFKSQNENLPGMPPLFRFSDDDKIRQNFVIEAVSEPPTTGYMFEAYFHIANDYGGTGELPTFRHAFLLPSEKRAALLKALAKNGYVDKLEDSKFRWTGKIGAVMMSASVPGWLKEDADRKIINENDVLHQSLVISEKLNDPLAEKPPEHCHIHVGTELLASAIMNFWNGFKWTNKALAEPVIYFDEAVFIAELVGNQEQ